MDEIKNTVTGKTYVCFEPTLDYVVVKIPKWPFDKFVKASRTLGTQMKATGEVMAISSSFEAAIMKAIRSLELGIFTLEQDIYKKYSDGEIREKIKDINDERLLVLAEAIRRGITLEDINDITKIDMFFLNKIKNLVLTEEKLKTMSLSDFTPDYLEKVKKLGFTDGVIAKYVGCSKRKSGPKKRI